MEPDEVDQRFSPYALAELEIAEQLAPWGEAAANLRMEYLAAVIQAASEGYTKESRESAQGWRSWLRVKLFGPQPPKRSPRAKDFVRRKG